MLNIKILYLCLALMAFPMGAKAYEPDICENFRDMAEVTMLARLEGASYGTMLHIANTTDVVPTIAREMVVSAYGSPQYLTEGMKQWSIVNFGEYYYADCVKHLGEDR